MKINKVSVFVAVLMGGGYLLGQTQTKLGILVGSGLLLLSLYVAILVVIGFDFGQWWDDTVRDWNAFVHGHWGE